MAGDEDADAAPQQAQAAELFLVLRADKGPPKFDAMGQLAQKSRLVVKELVAVKPLRAHIFQKPIHQSQAVGSDQFPAGLIPKDQVQVVVVKGIEVDLSSGTLLNRAEADFSMFMPDLFTSS